MNTNKPTLFLVHRPAIVQKQSSSRHGLNLVKVLPEIPWYFMPEAPFLVNRIWSLSFSTSQVPVFGERLLE